MRKNIYNEIKKNKAISILTALVLGGIFVFYGYGGNGDNSGYEMVKVGKGDFTREVSASGKVASPNKIELRFKNGGRIADIAVKTGDKVKAGDILAKLDNKEISAQLAETKAQVDVSYAELSQYEAAASYQQAILDKLVKGTRPEEIKISESKVESYKVSLGESRSGAINQLQDLYSKSNDSVKNKIDQMFAARESNTAAFRLNFQQGDSRLRIKAVEERSAIESSLNRWRISLDNLSVNDNFNSYFDDAKANVDLMRSLFEDSALLLDSFVPDAYSSAYPTKADIDNYKSLVSAARMQVDASAIGLSVAKEKLKAAESGLVVAENELALGKAGATSDQIAAQVALVEQAKANIATQSAQIKQAEASEQRIKAQAEETVLFAPVDGVATNVNGNAGETIMPTEVAVYMLPTKKLEIDVDISEEDVVSVSVGQEARVIFDAFGNDVMWRGKVAQIDPAETIKGGAIYYKTKVLLDSDDERIRSGMSADVWIKVFEKGNALFIPSIAVKEKNGGGKFVEILENNKVRQKEVRLGQKGTGGMVEIISGLSEGEGVIISNKGNKQ